MNLIERIHWTTLSKSKDLLNGMITMRRNQIRRALDTKFRDWVSSIDDLTVKRLVSNNSIITGGCIPSMLLGEKVHDYDVYFKNRETAEAVAKYYTNKYSVGCDHEVALETATAEYDDDDTKTNRLQYSAIYVFLLRFKTSTVSYGRQKKSSRL